MNYNFLCAVDTNTRIINGYPVSVTGVAIAIHDSFPGPDGIRGGWRFDVPFCMEFVGVKMTNPEHVGWVGAFEELSQRNMINSKMKVGLIVDSDLGNLNDFNQRKKPLFESRYLPEEVVLIYASADISNENVAGKSIAIADEAARQILEAISSGRVPFNNKSVQHPFYERYRIIETSVKIT